MPPSWNKGDLLLREEKGRKGEGDEGRQENGREGESRGGEWRGPHVYLDIFLRIACVMERKQLFTQMSSDAYDYNF